MLAFHLPDSYGMGWLTQDFVTFYADVVLLP